ncbi:glucosyltransferase [Dissophora globulifera]|uniref:Dol-P-Glc:Glc(2)Man(9)GlcNAc(2)-PP-Dol alpha-1,2-glucosyltransferase n=1 Tax=Dissophora globulifera TaxID=979702 RepID=A0A9P6UZ78_9FUNG|nr:glucosyltransferase [Dissophora globulifera]
MNTNRKRNAKKLCLQGMDGFNPVATTVAQSPDVATQLAEQEFDIKSSSATTRPALKVDQTPCVMMDGAWSGEVAIFQSKPVVSDATCERQHNKSIRLNAAILNNLESHGLDICRWYPITTETKASSADFYTIKKYEDVLGDKRVSISIASIHHSHPPLLLMPRLVTPSFLVGLHLLVFAVIAAQWNKTVPDPYMDEIFHVPQAQRYCQGDYWTWDPKLTTPPGLYIISNLLLAAKRPLCSTFLLRVTNLVYPIVTLYTVAALLKELHPHLSRSERFNTAAVIISFPILYFFNFMYYTDGGSAAFVLVSWLAAKKKYHFSAAVGSALAVTFRQTNIIWALFVLGTSLLDLSTTAERRQFDPKAAFVYTPLQVVRAVIGFVRMLISKLPSAIVMALPHLGLLAGFASFIKWNGGIVLGDKANHVPSPHVVQLFYFVIFAAGLSIFAILGTVPLRRLLKMPTSRSWPFVFAIASIMVFCVQRFTNVHPFLLADNRHYTFYLWRLLSRYEWVRLYALVPCYMAAAWFCWQAIATEQTILWTAIYILATALTLIPSPLIEFRYFITPYLIYRIAMRQPRGAWLLLELITYASVNAFTIWMFLKRPFQWRHEAGLQRFMW